MKRFTAYLFCALYLLSTTEAYQLLKIPIILEHFHEHQKENKDITFLEFLDIHYMHGSPMDDDYDRDMQLPFKTMNHHVNMTPVHVKDLTSSTLSILSPTRETVFVVVDDQGIPSRYLSSIFQPPRV